NGVGVRIFINRASSSIRRRGQKILRLVPTPSNLSLAPRDGAPFKESSFRKNLDTDINPRAHPRAATMPSLAKSSSLGGSHPPASKQNIAPAAVLPSAQFDFGQVLGMFKTELQSVLTSVFNDAVASACRKEAALNREWFEERGIPKAVRVAQHEAFGVLR